MLRDDNLVRNFTANSEGDVLSNCLKRAKTFITSSLLCLLKIKVSIYSDSSAIKKEVCIYSDSSAIAKVCIYSDSSVIEKSMHI